MTVILMKEPKQLARSKTETMLLTLEIMDQWKAAPFQRPLKENPKVREIADKLREEGGVIGGVITLGTLPNDPALYLIDGQHRRHAGVLSGLNEFLAEVRVMAFASLADMANEYVILNSVISRMQPDDILRGLEESTPTLGTIRRRCPFVGYSQVRRGDARILLGMAATIRAWYGSAYETPTPPAGSCISLARDFTPEMADELCKFLTVAKASWGGDPENYKLWGTLNLLMCMWLWRVLVINTERRGAQRYAIMTVDQFKKALMRVSAERDYVDWLSGRNVMERDRAPCYRRLRMAFINVLREENQKNTRMPQPPWAKSF